MSMIIASVQNKMFALFKKTQKKQTSMSTVSKLQTNLMLKD